MTYTAQVILEQLGGSKFIAMTGAKNFTVTSESDLLFTLPNRKVNRVVIGYDEGNDTYSMHFLKFANFDLHQVDSFSQVQANQLQSIFTEVTGLDTHL